MALEFPISVDEEASLPLHRQVYGHLRKAILEGRLPAGTKLPSTRALAAQLSLARNTISAAYDQLLAEGYLLTRNGSGTYVCGTLPDETFRPSRQRPTLVPPPIPAAAPRLSRWAGRALEGAQADRGSPPASGLPFDFRHGCPALDRFPTETWCRLLALHLQRGERQSFDYAPSAGYAPLRHALADYLRRSRAVRCSPEQVLIVNGSQQGLDLVARLLLDPGDVVIVEDPGYAGARRAFAAHGATLLPAPVDAAGLVSEGLERLAAGTSPRLVYATPSHQFPTGALMSLPRRLALLRWARAHGALVLEDDYDSEFRYAGRPVEALQGLDEAGTVIYLGTFSKVLFPALRIGYLVLPEPLIEAARTAKWLSDRFTPTLEQQALAEFFEEGHFERHLLRMRQVYHSRRDAFLSAVERELGQLVDPVVADTGLHAMVRLRGAVAEGELVARAAGAGVGIYPAGPHYLQPPEGVALVMGFTGLDELHIAEGLRRLGKVVRELAR